MYIFENPVLQRELLVNLRTRRAMMLLIGYNLVLGILVFLAWPQQRRLDLTQGSDEAKNLIDLFFLGQYVLASLMAPSFAAGSITGEKERKTYEMLLASPLRPAAVVLGKLFASLAHLAVLIFSSLPIVMLCLPLGGVSLYEVLAAYLALMLSVALYGMISVACSSYFRRTASALVVSYLVILPLALVAVLLWSALGQSGEFRLILTVTVVPAVFGVICVGLFARTAARLLHPPDVGSEGKEVIDIEDEHQHAVGLVIHADQFPDRLLVPAPRTTLLPDGINPVFDKELRSEIFSQGTLMLRVVIMVSMVLAVPLMAVFLYLKVDWAPWYIAYVLLFNVLVGPVFSAGSVTGERERQTLEMLLTTMISPGQILWGKILSGLRVSTVLTSFVTWPVLWAFLMGSFGWNNFWTVPAYLGIIVMTCLSTAIVAMFCSVLCKKTSTSLMTSYLLIGTMFCLPLAMRFFTETYYPGTAAAHWVASSQLISPLSAAFNAPLKFNVPGMIDRGGTWQDYFNYLGLTAAINIFLLAAIYRLFQTRWRVAE
jgi:ABC-type transport system involved in multi-copper enzyme maturation permease subunit